MNDISWKQYNQLNNFECPEYPQVSQEYIYTYPVNFGPLDALDIWNETYRFWSPKHYSLYINFPFCKEMCRFCTFCHIPWKEELGRAYIDSLKKEILVYSKHPIFRSVKIHSIYFGGGTPSLIPVDQFGEVLDILLQNFVTSPDLEITVECNPVNASLRILKNLSNAGVNRISFGVQTFNKKLASTLGIKNRDEAGIAAIDLAREIGFQQISVDLMYGIPGQTIDDFIADIDNSIELGINGLSLYWLDIEGSSLEKAISTLPTPETAREFYYAGRHRVLEKGFNQQTPPDFYREKRCTFANIAWKAPQGGTIGFGAGAITFFFNSWTYINVNKVKDYIHLLNKGRLPVLGGIRVKNETLMEKFPILGFRCLTVPVDPFKQIFGIPFTQRFGKILSYLKKLGLISQTEKEFQLTTEGLWFVDNISREFYGQDNRNFGQPWAKLLEQIRTPTTRRVLELPNL